MPTSNHDYARSFYSNLSASLRERILTLKVSLSEVGRLDR